LRFLKNSTNGLLLLWRGAASGRLGSGADGLADFFAGPEPHGQGRRKQERLKDRAMEIDVYRKDDNDQDQRDLHQQEAEPPDAPFKLRLRRAEFKVVRDLAEFGLPAGRNDHRLAAAADHVGAHEQGAGPLGQRGISGHGLEGLLRRIRLSGQRGLIDKQVLGFDDSAVARNAAAG
jgi:hypothetical protein